MGVAACPESRRAHQGPPPFSLKNVTESELDTQCESFLADKFGLQIDFTSETAVATLREWGLITSSSGGSLQAVPVMKAVEILDGIWDNLYDVDVRRGVGGRHTRHRRRNRRNRCLVKGRGRVGAAAMPSWDLFPPRTASFN